MIPLSPQSQALVEAAAGVVTEYRETLGGLVAVEDTDRQMQELEILEVLTQ